MPPPDRQEARPDLDWRRQLGSVRPLAGTPGEAYLRRRGIPLNLAHAAAVRYSPDWYGRPAILFPVYDREGRLVACQGRYVDGRDDPKARTAGQPSLGLFATPGARTAEVVAIVEAPLDALSLAACGLPALALLGTSIPEGLFRACAFRRVLVATDADAAGDAAAAKLAPGLRACGARPERLRPVAVKDWNEALQADPKRLYTSLSAHLTPDAPPAAREPAAGWVPAPDDPGELILTAPEEPLLAGEELVAAVIRIFDGRRVPIT